MRKRIVVGLVAAIVLGGAVIMLVNRGTTDGVVDREGRLEIVMQDYRFEVDEWTVPASTPITLVLVNRDEVSHPLTFGGELVFE